MTPVVIVISLFLMGLFLLLMEIFIPGFGVVGILGILCILASGVVAYFKLSPKWGVLAFVMGAGIAIAMVLLFPKTRVAKAMVLRTSHQGSAAEPQLRELVGQRGVALTPLRPAGTVAVEGRPVDAVTEGQFVEQGKNVRVIKASGGSVVVEAVEENTSSSEQGS
jgi:membrane-bound serine protease (ClpP class)